ncbi:22560_t:CDS:2, partial [Gigaspora rosea]
EPPDNNAGNTIQSIQRAFEDLNTLDFSNDMMENSDSQIPDDKLEMGNLSVANLLQNYTDLYNEKTKELELISSVIATFQKTLKILLLPTSTSIDITCTYLFVFD